MSGDPLLARVQSVWEGLADATVSFPRRGSSVVASPDSWLCPPAWVGIVVLEDSAIVTVPSEAMVEPVTRAFERTSLQSLTDPAVLRAMLPVREVLGPATLAYVSLDDFLPAPSDTATELLAPGHPDLLALLAAVGEEDADESGIGEITAPATVVRDDGKVVAAAGHTLWPDAIAHVGVLTDPSVRGRGLARQVASGAVERALADGLVPQWRARPPASRRVARSLGFREMGSQLSVQLDPELLTRL